MRHKFGSITVKQKDNRKKYNQLYYQIAVMPTRKSTATGRTQTRTRCPMCGMLVYPANFDKPISTDIKYFAGRPTKLDSAIKKKLTFRNPILDDPVCQFHRIQYEEAVKKKLILLHKFFNIISVEEAQLISEYIIREAEKKEFLLKEEHKQFDFGVINPLPTPGETKQEYKIGMEADMYG